MRLFYKMKEDLYKKQEKLNNILSAAGRVVIAYSGGVDSTYLLHAAHKTLGDGVLAVTAHSPSMPESELEEAKIFCAERGIKHIICATDEMEIDEYRHNSPRRCYFCKHELFQKIMDIAAENDIHTVCDGSNTDDEGDYRPGLEALSELGIKSPLREAGMAKQDIRDLSNEAGLPTWNKPAFACLASRIPYGEDITPEKLRMAGEAEEFLRGKGFDQVRVRVHGKVARIELVPDDICKMIDENLRKEISVRLKELGFSYVSLDLDGYRQGSMNEVLDK